MTFRLNKNVTIIDLIKVYKKVIPNKICKNVITRGENNSEWKKHTWASYKQNNFLRSDINTDFVQQSIGSLSRLEIMPVINECIKNYIDEVSGLDQFKVNGVTIPNLNKYELGTAMAPHLDHIYSIFNGTIKGIPILSIVGLLNDDFEGGDFVFWNDQVIKLEAGDILVFPSLFIYPHKVSIITKGTRYSVVSWAY